MSLALFNYLESVLWFMFALILLVNATRFGVGHRLFKVTLVTAVTFFLFGISDVIEAHTGAWWHPFGLLLLKVACVLTLAGCYYRYRQIAKIKMKTKRAQE